MKPLPKLTHDSLRFADARLWDVWIANRLFPWSGIRYDDERQDWYGTEPVSVQWMQVPKYSESIILAIDVVEKMEEKYPEDDFELRKVGKWWARFGSYKERSHPGLPSAAIIMAALELIALVEDVKQ